ncbi:MAG: carboxypeptidase-like regulatory domain-containing protein [Bacillota bacterium]|nr:carboxypeptidase-like regulatory domain-containing protein [Bacillota bacterium]
MSVTLKRGAVFTGTVFYNDGEPARKTTVSALIFSTDNATLTNNTSARVYLSVVTDDRGVFRIAGLPEGLYTLEVQISEMQGQQLAPVYLGGTSNFNAAKKIRASGTDTMDGLDITLPRFTTGDGEVSP